MKRPYRLFAERPAREEQHEMMDPGISGRIVVLVRRSEVGVAPSQGICSGALPAAVGSCLFAVELPIPPPHYFCDKNFVNFKDRRGPPRGISHLETHST